MLLRVIVSITAAVRAHRNASGRGDAIRGVASLVALLLIAACQYDPHAHLYTTERPAPSEVAGVYRLTEETLLHSGFSDVAKRSCLVRLNADGTFEAVNVPPWSLERPGKGFPDRLMSGSGRWRIDSVGAVDNGWSSRRVWGVYFDSPAAKLAAAHLTGRRPPYGLIFLLGDPDAGEALILTRE